MKKHIAVAFVATFFLCSAMNAQKVHCSYFITFNWGCSYPGMFTAQFHPAEQTLSVTPLPGNFGGIVSVAVFTDLNCGSQPKCSQTLKPPVVSQTYLSETWWACAMEAQPLFIRLCWVEKPAN
jgi:hypothetical protein